MSVNKRNLQDIVVLAVGKLIQVSVGFATLRLITELLSEKEVGVYYTLMTIINLLAFVFFNPLGQFYGRNLVHWQKTGNVANATAFLIGLRVLAMPVALFCAVGLFYLFEYDKYFSLTSYALFIVVAIFALTHGVLLNASNVLVGRMTFTLCTVGTLIAGLLASVTAIQLNQTAMAWMYGLFTVQITVSAILYIKVVGEDTISNSRMMAAFDRPYLSKVFFFILPVSLTLLLQWGQTNSFRLIVEDLYSAEILASIAVGMALSTAIFSALESLASQFYMPIYLRKITHKNREQRAAAWNQLAGIMLPIYVAVAIYVVALAPHLANALVAEKFRDVFGFAMIGALIELFRVTTNLVYLVSQSEIKTGRTVLPYFVGTALLVSALYSIDVTGRFWLVPVIIAAAFFVTLTLMISNMKKLLEIRIDWSISACALLAGLPLLAVLFLYGEQSSLMGSLAAILLGGLYLLVVYYALLRERIQRMLSV